MSLTFEIVGYMAGLCTTFCMLPQAVKTIRTKDVKSFSIVSYSTYNIGIIGWVVYGAYLKSVPIVAFNATALIFTLSILYTIIKYKNKKTPCKCSGK